MHSRSSRPATALVASVLLMLGGCEAIGTIFEVGMWFGIVLVVVIVAAVLWVMSRFRKRD